MKRTIESTAWARSPENIPRIYGNEDDYSSIPVFHNTDMTDMGWIRIGTATIHLDLIDPKDTIAAQVESLEAQCKKVMADSEATMTMLRSKINDLLAIENSGGEK